MQDYELFSIPHSPDVIEMGPVKPEREKSADHFVSDNEAARPSNSGITSDDDVVVETEPEYIQGWTLALVMFALLMSYFLVALDLVRSVASGQQ